MGVIPEGVLQRPWLEGWTRENPEHIAGLPVHAQSVPAGQRVGSSSSKPGIGTKVFSALSPDLREAPRAEELYGTTLYDSQLFVFVLHREVAEQPCTEVAFNL
ncbi:hypothetical protein Cadr_000011442 [Camelus dromedarius]|uniref:Uncharacterized protein n=1 Tax=Camelus dromedarius TaxID=9838 RepID=A0A5N4DUP7_CAMDR|nr:hypothetical protein Cadr_000011442 [Camelus dromedarius]